MVIKHNTIIQGFFYVNKLFNFNWINLKNIIKILFLIKINFLILDIVFITLYYFFFYNLNYTSPLATFFKVFLKKSLMLAKAAFIWSKIVKTIILQFIPVMQSWIFSIITPVFSVTRSSNIIILICWFAAQENLLLSMLKSIC